MELLNCKRYMREYAAQHMENGIEWKEVMNNEVAEFACAVVDPARLERMIERHRQVFQARQIVPDLILGPPGFKLFLSMEMMGERVGYNTYGPQGQAIFNEGPRAAGVLRGDLVVFESRAFDIGIGGPAVLPLETPVTVGEAYPMTLGHRRGTDLNGGAREYETGQRDIFVYDNGGDDFFRVSFRKAFLYSGAFENSDHGTMPDRIYGEICKELNAEATAAESKEFHAAVFKEYRDSAALHDTMSGEEKPSRALPMFIAHDVIATRTSPGQYFVPRILGQLDINVANTSDFVDAARVAQAKYGDAKGVATALGDCLVADEKDQVAKEKAAGADGTRLNAKGDLFLAWDVASPAVTIAPQSAASFLFNAMPLAIGTEALVYAPIDAAAGTLGAPAANKLSAWLKRTQDAAGAAGADNAEFKAAIDTRRRVLTAAAEALGKAREANILTVRGDVQKAFDDNVTSRGDYKAGKSADSLEKDLKKVFDAAATARPATDAASSSTLFKFANNELAVNPYMTAAPVTEVDAAAASAIAPAFGAYEQALANMEERVLLHGDAHLFDSNAPLQWVAHVASTNQFSDVDVKATAAVAREYEKAHAELNASVLAAVPELATAADAAGHDDDGESAGGLQTYEEYVANMSAPTDVWAPTASSSSIDVGFGASSFMQQGVMYKAVPPVGAIPTVGADRMNRGAYLYRVSAAAKAKVPAKYLDTYLVLLRVKNTRDCWVKLMDLDIPVPINLMLWRLWIRNRMYTAVMMRSGLETGGTVFGSANFVLYGEGSTKTLEGHLTFNYASIVWNQKAVLHLPNIIPRRHLGGWGLGFVQSPQEIFEVDEDKRGSFVVSVCPITENVWNWPINFVTKREFIDPIRGTTTTYKDLVDLVGVQSSAAHNERLWGLDDSVQFSEAYDTYSRRYNKPNTVAYMGTHFVYAAATGKGMYRNGNGHLSGNRTGRGVKAVFDGSATMLPAQLPTMYEISY